MKDLCNGIQGRREAIADKGRIRAVHNASADKNEYKEDP